MLGVAGTAFALQGNMALVLIKIHRRESNQDSLLGEMTVYRPFGGGSSFPLRFQILELPFIDNINNVSSIPAGSYPAKVRTDGHKGWRLELTIPSRSNVQIHSGNTTKQILGCILIGTRRSGRHAVRASQLAMALLRNEVEENNRHPEIKVSIFDEYSAASCSIGGDL